MCRGWATTDGSVSAVVHRSVYPRHSALRVLWLIWMALMTIACGAIAIVLALVAGVCLLMLVTGWVVGVH